MQTIIKKKRPFPLMRLVDSLIPRSSMWIFPILLFVVVVVFCLFVWFFGGVVFIWLASILKLHEKEKDQKKKRHKES